MRMSSCRVGDPFISIHVPRFRCSYQGRTRHRFCPDKWTPSGLQTRSCSRLLMRSISRWNLWRKGIKTVKNYAEARSTFRATKAAGPLSGLSDFKAFEDPSFLRVTTVMYPWPPWASIYPVEVSKSVIHQASGNFNNFSRIRVCAR